MGFFDVFKSLPFLIINMNTASLRYLTVVATLTLSSIFCLDVSQADVVITEFMADNQSTIFDEDGDDPDWIEIHNSGSSAVNLSGYNLTDDSAKPDKWTFPLVSIEPGEFLVVFASGKDRVDPGGALHTNFSLNASGEYLALVGQDKTTILQEFAPEFSRQEHDESYGLPFSRSGLIESGAAAQILVPANGALGTSWTARTFSPSGWLSGTVGVGFGLSAPGFTVEEVRSGSQLSNISGALSALDGTSTDRTTAVSPVVNFLDTGGDGRFGNNLVFPNGGGDDFAVRATGTVEVPTSGTWTFGTNSDDGVRVRIDGTNIINDDSLHAAADRFGNRFLSAGSHSIELVFFERGGGAEVELFAASGTHTSFNGGFVLVGDVAGGGLVVNTVPEGGAGAGAVQTDIGSSMKGVRSSVYLRVPFSLQDSSGVGALSLSMRYNDGFIAYLNGVEVARRNAPGGAVWNSAATASRNSDESLSPEGINVTAAKDSLVDGTNVLSIHGLNISAADDAFVIAPELTEGSVMTRSVAYFESPTPGAVNSETSSLGRVLDPSISPKRGIYTTTQSVTIENFTSGAQVRYTTNGSAPTATAGTVYSGPIQVNSTTVLRFGAFKSGFDSSRIKTHTYLFLDDIVAQSTSAPAGWPNGSANNQTFNYGMDPNVTSGNEAEIVAALSAIPTFSIALKQEDLTSSSTGIYTHAGTRGFAWERAASVELLNDAEGGFQVDAGLRIRGGFSRSGGNPKHAFRLFFRKEYGDAKLNYPLFGDEGTSRYDNIDLRTSQNYSWAFQGNGNNTFLREVFARDSQSDMGQAHTRSRYAHVYLNGQYWGLYMTQERSEASFGESYFGGDRFDYDAVKSAGSSGGYQTEATDGSMATGSAWHQLWQKTREIGTANASNTNYFALQGLSSDGITPSGQPALLDSANLIDYMMCVFYTGGYDAPLSTFLNNASNNWFGVRNSKGMEGFNFFMHDNEHSLGTGGNSNNRVGSGSSNIPWKEQYSSITDFSRSNPQYMHEDLAHNKEYRMAFADRAHVLLFNDGLLTRDRVGERIERRRVIVDQVILAESARWGDSKREPAYGRSNWENAVNDIFQFVDKGTDGGGTGSGRAAVLISQLRGYDRGNKPLYSPIDAPSFNQHGDYVASGTELAMTGGAILFTDDGMDPREIGGGIYSGADSFQGSTTTETLIGSGSAWKYLDDGSNQGTGWRLESFNDGSWVSGNAQLGYGDGDEATEVGFGPNGNDKYITTYFRKTFQVEDKSQITGIVLELLRDDGAVAYINGSEVARSNMPGGTISYTTRSAAVTGGGDESTFFLFEPNASVLHEGTNTFAVEVHQTSGTSSDTGFDLRLKATRTFSSTPIVLSGEGEVNIMARAKEGSTWSALNQALFFVGMDPPSAGNVVVSEIHYHPAAPSAAEIAAGHNDRDLFEFVELMNVGSRTINLRDAFFVSGIEFDFNNANITQLAAGERVLLVRNRAAFEFRYGTALPVAGEFEGNLANGGELLRIAGPDSSTIREFVYNDTAPWPETADGLGFSLVLQDPNSAPAHGDPTNWAASTAVGGTPGAGGSAPILPVLVNEVLTHTDFPQVDAIELYNPNPQIS
jgi:hypothetical protein